MNTKHGIFVLTTNHIEEIDITIQNRCHLIPMFAAKPEQWLPVLNQVFAACGMPAQPASVLLPVISADKGSARDILTDAMRVAIKARRRQAA